MASIHRALLAWLTVDELGPNIDLGCIKTALATHGLNPRSWHLYLDFGEPRLLLASAGLLRSLDEATAEDFDLRQLLKQINSTQFVRPLINEDDCCLPF